MGTPRGAPTPRMALPTPSALSKKPLPSSTIPPPAPVKSLSNEELEVVAVRLSFFLFFSVGHLLTYCVMMMMQEKVWQGIGETLRPWARKTLLDEGVEDIPSPLVRLPFKETL